CDDQLTDTTTGSWGGWSHLTAFLGPVEGLLGTVGGDALPGLVEADQGAAADADGGRRVGRQGLLEGDGLLRLAVPTPFGHVILAGALGVAVVAQALHAAHDPVGRGDGVVGFHRPLEVETCQAHRAPPSGVRPAPPTTRGMESSSKSYDGSPNTRNRVGTMS